MRLSRMTDHRPNSVPVSRAGSRPCSSTGASLEVGRSFKRVVVRIEHRKSSNLLENMCRFDTGLVFDALGLMFRRIGFVLQFDFKLKLFVSCTECSKALRSCGLLTKSEA